MATMKKLKGCVDELTVFKLGELVDDWIRIERLMKSLSVHARIYGLDIHHLSIIRKRKLEAQINNADEEKQFLEAQLKDLDHE